MDMEEKIKKLNLLPKTKKMDEYLSESFPLWEKSPKKEKFDFVWFFGGQPQYYSKRYIEEHSLDELLAARAEVIECLEKLHANQKLLG